MIFWIDAQLPPALAEWLASKFGVQAKILDAIGLRHAQDAAIFEALRVPGHVLVSKDEDFVDFVARLGPPPQLLWVTCGNITNRALRELFTATFPAALALLQQGEAVVELS